MPPPTLGRYRPRHSPQEASATLLSVAASFMQGLHAACHLQQRGSYQLDRSCLTQSALGTQRHPKFGASIPEQGWSWCNRFAFFAKEGG